MPLDPHRIDRNALDVVTLFNQEEGDVEYWLACTAAERWEAVEQIRQVLYGYDPSTARLQRVLEVVDGPWR